MGTKKGREYSRLLGYSSTAMFTERVAPSSERNEAKRNARQREG